MIFKHTLLRPFWRFSHLLQMAQSGTSVALKELTGPMKLIATTCARSSDHQHHQQQQSPPVKANLLHSWEKSMHRNLKKTQLCKISQYFVTEVTPLTPVDTHYITTLDKIKHRNVGETSRKRFLNWDISKNRSNPLHSIMALQYRFGGQSSATVDFRLYHSLTDSVIQGWKTAFRVSHTAQCVVLPTKDEGRRDFFHNTFIYQSYYLN